MDLNNTSHRRKNILTGEWVLVSPHRTKRPWNGKNEENKSAKLLKYDPECYLCPGNSRANGAVNDKYESTFVFQNDFSAILEVDNKKSINKNNLLIVENETGICKVVCFSPDHSKTLSSLSLNEIKNVIDVWQKEFIELGNYDHINYLQIFENKGSIMGCSNPHPHCQIWAQNSIPNEPFKELTQQEKYFSENKSCMLCDYLKLEKELCERIVYENDEFVCLTPFWAIWPFETIIVSKRHFGSLKEITEDEKTSFADILSVITKKYDKLFDISFPYSAGIHQNPTDGNTYGFNHFHMHFYPPLLRSATIKKFMVGYELMAEAQRDITAESAAERLREL